jgi:prepilin-type N-terminal cleavage/methylation domain-containing protein
MRQVHSRGFTLVELLIGMGIMVVVLSLVGAIFGSTASAYTVTAVAHEQHALSEATKQMLTYDLALAGYRGTSFDAYATNAFTGPTIAIVKGTSSTSSDTVAVRYFEDRYGSTGATETIARYTQHGGALLRSVDGGADQVVAEGIDRLTAAFILLDPTAAMSTSNPAIGATLRLERPGRAPDIHAVTFANAQNASLTYTPPGK